jgi:hypothetical protein
MSQQKSIFGTVKEKVFDYLESLIVGAVKEKINEFIRAFLRMLILLAATLTFFLIGFIYVTLGIIKALTIVIPEWASLIVIGLIILVLGYIVFREFSRKLK